MLLYLGSVVKLTQATGHPVDVSMLDEVGRSRPIGREADELAVG